MKKAYLAAAMLFGIFAWAQLPLQLEFPAGSSLQISSREIVFDLSKSGFPPRELPAFYYPVKPAEGLNLRLFSNLDGGWALAAELQPLVARDGNWLSPENVEVRLDNGPWLSLASEVSLLIGSGPTGGYREHKIEFRLLVRGDELPGSYQGVLVFSLSRL